MIIVPSVPNCMSKWRLKLYFKLYWLLFKQIASKINLSHLRQQVEEINVSVMTQDSN